MLKIIVILVVGLAVPLFFVLIYLSSAFNRLVTQRHRYKNAYSQIDLQLKRRYDLIPNLVETAKDYLKHERGTLEAVMAARNSAASANARAAKNPGEATAMKELITTETALTRSLGKLMALTNASPDWKANQTAAGLMEELASTDSKVALARQAYNETVRAYDTTRKTFPTRLIAGLFNFGPAELCLIDQAQEIDVP